MKGTTAVASSRASASTVAPVASARRVNPTPASVAAPVTLKQKAMAAAATAATIAFLVAPTPVNALQLPSVPSPADVAADVKSKVSGLSAPSPADVAADVKSKVSGLSAPSPADVVADVKAKARDLPKVSDLPSGQKEPGANTPPPGAMMPAPGEGKSIFDDKTSTGKTAKKVAEVAEVADLFSWLGGQKDATGDSNSVFDNKTNKSSNPATSIPKAIADPPVPGARTKTAMPIPTNADLLNEVARPNPNPVESAIEELAKDEGSREGTLVRDAKETAKGAAKGIGKAIETASERAAKGVPVARGDSAFSAAEQAAINE